MNFVQGAVQKMMITKKEQAWYLNLNNQNKVKRRELIKCPKCGNDNIIGMEYAAGPYRYDGVSEYRCLKCDYRQGRWTGKELKEGEWEPPFGKKKYITEELKEWNL